MADLTRQSGGVRRRRRFLPHYSVLEDLRCERRFRVPPSLSRPKRMYLNCPYCGFEPPNDLPPLGLCPKCGGHSWERFTLAEALVPEHMKHRAPVPAVEDELVLALASFGADDE